MPSPVVIPTQTNAPTYFILSLLSFILCSFIGGIFMFCIAPALACSSMVSFNWVIRTIACQYVSMLTILWKSQTGSNNYVSEIFFAEISCLRLPFSPSLPFCPLLSPCLPAPLLPPCPAPSSPLPSSSPPPRPASLYSHACTRLGHGGQPNGRKL